MTKEIKKDERITWIAFWVGIAAIAVGAIAIWKWPQLYQTIP